MNNPKKNVTIVILNRWSGTTLHKSHRDMLSEAIVEALALNKSLRGADLYGADLHGADLCFANLCFANLRDANLSNANLINANLHRADLCDADLHGVDLRDANLSDADMSGANLCDANLCDANLRGVDLRGVNLSDANLSDANLTPIRDDLWVVLSEAPAEVEGLRAAIADGRIDGSTYEGECACLVGTLANVAHSRYDQLPFLRPNSGRPAERFFLAIRKGDTPETSEFSRLALEWTDEWLGRMHAAFGTRPEPVTT